MCLVVTTFRLTTCCRAVWTRPGLAGCRPSRATDLTQDPGCGPTIKVILHTRARGMKVLTQDSRKPSIQQVPFPVHCKDCYDNPSLLLGIVSNGRLQEYMSFNTCVLYMKDNTSIHDHSIRASCTSRTTLASTTKTFGCAGLTTTTLRPRM